MTEKKELYCMKEAAHEDAHGHLHGQIHPHMEGHMDNHLHGQICAKRHIHDISGQHAHGHGHEHSHELGHGHKSGRCGLILTIRSHTGLSGDILLTGLAVLNMLKLGLEPGEAPGNQWLNEILAKILPDFSGCAKITRTRIEGIGGYRLELNLPATHEHRNLADIQNLINAADMSESGKKTAIDCFELLASCEAFVHGASVTEIHFHEVGALDSILDICGVCELFGRLHLSRLVCGPLPVADGHVHCAHGVLPTPAPAVLRLLKGVPVYPFAGECDAGELLTPTSLALLHALHAEFGKWPNFAIEETALAYGQRTFAHAPNGVIFALGEAR